MATTLTAPTTEVATSRMRWQTTALQCVALALAVYGVFAIDLLGAVRANPWTQWTYLGMWILYLACAPSALEAALTAVVGVMFARFAGFTAGFAYPGGPMVTAGAYAGVAAILALTWQAPRARPARLMLFRCLGLIAMGIGIGRLLALNAQVAAWKLDASLFALDLRLTGGVPAFTIAASRFYQWFRPSQLLIYYALPCATMIVYAAHLRRARPGAPNFLLITIANLTIGYALYMFYPAAGPAYAFSGFPHTVPTLTSMAPVWLGAPANAMPSLHVSTALLLWWNSREWPVGRYVALAFLVLTVAATLGLGEHYCLDLVVAVPYALLIQSLGDRGPHRRACCITGAVLTTAWLVTLKWGFPVLDWSPWLLRAAVVLTLVQSRRALRTS